MRLRWKDVQMESDWQQQFENSIESSLQVSSSTEPRSYFYFCAARNEEDVMKRRGKEEGNHPSRIPQLGHRALFSAPNELSRVEMLDFRKIPRKSGFLKMNAG
jgi:hypothetical protein